MKFILCDGECELTAFSIDDLRKLVIDWSCAAYDLCDVIHDMLDLVPDDEWAAEAIDFQLQPRLTVAVMTLYIAEMNKIFDLIFHVPHDKRNLRRLLYFGDDPCKEKLLNEHSNMPEEERKYHKEIADIAKEEVKQFHFDDIIFKSHSLKSVAAGTKLAFDEVDKICICELFYGIMYRYYLECEQEKMPEPGSLTLEELQANAKPRDLSPAEISNNKYNSIAVIEELRRFSTMAEHIEKGGAETIPIFNEYYKLIFRLLDDDSIEPKSYLKTTRAPAELGIMNLILSLCRHWRTFMMFRILFTLVLKHRKMEDVLAHIEMVYATGANGIAIFDVNKAYMAFNANFPSAQYVLDKPYHILALCA